MKPIEKYKVDKESKDGYHPSLSISPGIEVYFNIYPGGEVISCQVEDIVKALNLAYTQAVIDMINGELAIGKPMMIMNELKKSDVEIAINTVEALGGVT